MKFAANYSSPTQHTNFFLPEVTLKTAKMARVCSSLSERIGTSRFEAGTAVMGAEEVIFPWVPRRSTSNMPCGERIDGCDYGNAEVDFERLRLQSKRIRLCHTNRTQFKIDSVEWDRIAAAGNGGQRMYEKLINDQVAQDLIEITDASNLFTPIGMAAPYMHGKKAGRISRKVDLGDQTTPLAITTAGDGKARKVISKLSQVLGEANIKCGQDDKIAIYMSAGFYAHLIEDYTALKSGSCCATDAEAGMFKDSFGHEIHMTNLMPCVKGSDGRPLEYVVAVAKNDFAVPFRMHYGKKWLDKGHWRELPIAYSWGSYLFDNESAAYAVVDVASV